MISLHLQWQLFAIVCSDRDMQLDMTDAGLYKL